MRREGRFDYGRSLAPTGGSAPFSGRNLMDDTAHIDAHRHSIRHHDEIMRSDTCGCFYCCRIFRPSDIAEWIDDGDSASSKTALCPQCKIDSVVGSASGYTVDAELLRRMNEHWF